jgi:hypothetical protein
MQGKSTLPQQRFFIPPNAQVRARKSEDFVAMSAKLE